MFFSELQFDVKSKTPLYKQLEAFIISGIRDGKLQVGFKLPSIRNLVKTLAISKPTVENALRHLVCNGYLTVKNKSGYFVADLGLALNQNFYENQLENNTPILFDFRDSAVDKEIFPITLWRRAIHRATKSNTIFSAYRNPQGEFCLRNAIAKYAFNARGVSCSAKQVVIASGMQALIPILINLLPQEDKHIAFEGKGFPQLEIIFKNHGWTIEYFQLQQLKKIKAKVIYIGSEINGGRRRLTSTERIQFLKTIQENNQIVLEDDYTGEFRNHSEAASSLQGMNPSANIVYLSSFSRLLTPTLRISFMVLPLSLIQNLDQKIRFYNQSASTLEQLALSDFLNSGYLPRHVKALRNQCTHKMFSLKKLIEQLAPNLFLIQEAPSGLALLLELQQGTFPVDFVTSMQSKGICLKQISEKTIVLGVTGIPLNKINQATKTFIASLT